jgi:hypothetical protein
MHPKDNISKAALLLTDSTKDVIKLNLVSAMKSKIIDVDQNVLQQLFVIIDASIDEGYHRGARTFDKSVEASLSLLLKDMSPNKTKK